MPIFSSASDQNSFVRPIYGLHGAYTLSQGATIPYFSTLLPLDRVVEELRIAEEVAPSLENEWTLTELFQREVDRERVTRDIVNGYLKDPTKLKFFNALTVVLLPKSSNGQLLSSFDETDTKQATIPADPSDPVEISWAEEAESGAIHNFGGVQYCMVGDQARLRWDRDSVHPVAVDGQHRLAALKLFKGEAELPQVARKTRIPVLFLLLDRRCGFQSLASDRHDSIRGIAREIFTDLNKNARRVDRARELILDDWSLEARCCRELMTNRTAIDSSEELPLTLIRWQEDNSRFDQGYFLNSLVNLELLTKIVLKINYPRDPMDQGHVEQFISSVGEAVGEDGALEHDGKSLLAYYRDAYLEEGDPISPLSRLPTDYLEEAVAGFTRRHKPWLVRLLTAPAPYSRLLKEARKRDMIEGDFGKYQAQTKRHRNEIADERGPDWRSSEIAEPERAIVELKDGHWFFKVIFQKALVELAREVCVENVGDPRIGGIEKLLTFLDLVDAKPTCPFAISARLEGSDKGLWTFIALNPGNQKIKVSSQVQRRLLATLRLWFYSWAYKEAGGQTKTAAELLKYFRATSNSTDWPNCDESTSVLEGCFTGRGFFGEEISELNEDERTKRKRKRAAQVLRAGGFAQ